MPSSARKKTLNSFLIIFYGLIMGAINKIPGVSGGIVAIIFGFYEKLILSFSRFDINSLVILRKEGFKSFYKHINGKFLVLLLFGIIMSFTSSFGQTFFISLFGPSIQFEYGLSHTSWGTIYLIGTLLSAIILTYSGSLIDYYRSVSYTHLTLPTNREV